MINNIMKNFKQGELILLAGCPDSGKTALVAEMAKYMAVEEKQDVLFFSLQHEKQDLIDKHFKNYSEKIIIDDTLGISITEVRNRCSQSARKWAFIDCLPLMSGSESCNSRVEEWQEIVIGLWTLAREAGAVIVATAPLSTNLNSSPTIQDLREYVLDPEKEAELLGLIFWNGGEINLEKPIVCARLVMSGEMVLHRHEKDLQRAVR